MIIKRVGTFLPGFTDLEILYLIPAQGVAYVANVHNII